MDTVANRTKSIMRSHSGNDQVVSNYETTCARIDEALVRLAEAQGNTRDATLVAINYMQVHRTENSEWNDRLRLMDNLIKAGGVESEIQLEPIRELASKMVNNSALQVQVWKTRVERLGESERDMQKRVSELEAARSQLKLAQSLVDSRQKLEALASSIVTDGEPLSTTGSVLAPLDLKKITALTREAEALAELKGWSVR